MTTTNATTTATKGNKTMTTTPRAPKGSVQIGSITILPSGIAAAEKALIAAQLRAIKAATARANKPVTEKKITVPRVLPAMTVTLVGVNKVLPAYADGAHEVHGWTQAFQLSTELVRQLRVAGHRLQGNYSTGQWTAVVDGAVLSITSPKPEGKKPTGPRKPKAVAA